jgi:hypothetical protein
MRCRVVLLVAVLLLSGGGSRQTSSPSSPCVLLAAAEADVDAAGGDDPEDVAEVDRILTNTQVVKDMRAQRAQHATEIAALEKALEGEIKAFYMKHDAALQKFRVIDAGLVQRVRNLESQVVAEAQELRDRAPTYSSWWLPAMLLLVSTCGIVGYLYRALQTVNGKNF